MIKKILFCFSLILVTSALNAQNSSPVFELYLDFNEHYLHNRTKAIEVAQQILNTSERLSEKQETNFYYKLATIYDNMNNSEMAIKFFSKVIIAEPDFYVPHRALGYLYLKDANPIINKINVAKGNKEQYKKYLNQYHSIIKKVVPHLEKATACDPNEETLNLIKKLYQQMNETDNLNTLDARLKMMSENCVTVLTDF